MQGYAVLDVLTARPRRGRARACAASSLRPCRARRPPIRPARWLRDVIRLIDDGALEGRRPIFVGGTGLYFRALAEGISEMPEIPDMCATAGATGCWRRGRSSCTRSCCGKIRRRRRRCARPTGSASLRALEVLESSGRSILDWQAVKGRPLIDAATAHFLVIEPDRQALVRRIDARFDRMLEAGALDEVQADHGDAARSGAAGHEGDRRAGAAGGRLPAKSASMTAIERAKIATRQYAKRQSTWFRNQFGPVMAARCHRPKRSPARSAPLDQVHASTANDPAHPVQVVLINGV